MLAASPRHLEPRRNLLFRLFNDFLVSGFEGRATTLPILALQGKN